MLSAHSIAAARRCLTAVLGALALGGGALAAQRGGTPIVISPALPTTADAVVLVVEPTCLDVFEPPKIAGNTITLTVGPPLPGSAGRCLLAPEYPLGKLAAGAYTVRQVDLSGDFLASSGFQVSAPATEVDLLAGQFAVTAVRFAVPGGGPLSASAVQLADASGYFWFFDPGSIELSVKILDGTMINGHFWVFIASSTTEPSTVTVTQILGDCALPGSTMPCPAKSYSTAAGTNQNFIDLGTFAAAPIQGFIDPRHLRGSDDALAGAAPRSAAQQCASQRISACMQVSGQLGSPPQPARQVASAFLGGT
jgi:hypothetical protein